MFKRLSITFWASAFVTLVCLLLVGLDGWRSWNARVALLTTTERATYNLARAVAQQADDTLKAADTALIEIEERVEHDGTDPASLRRLHQVMVDQVRNLPQLNGLFAYDEAGRWLVNSQPTLAIGMNNADREYFQFHRANSASGPHIGVPVISRSSGKWIIPVSRRLDHADGSFAGVVLATIDVDYFRRFYASLDVGEKGAVGLVSQDGILMLRRPFDENVIATSVAQTPVYQAFKRQRVAGSGVFRSTQDGVLRLGSYRPLDNYPLFVVAALAKDEVLTHWWRNTLLHTAGVVMLALMLAYFGRRLVLQIQARVQAEHELRQARDAMESLNRTLEKLALQDGLTGLANRRQFDVTLGNEFSRATRSGRSLAFIMIDVDCFKQYNDIYGHGAGDECLRAVSKIIRALTPRRPGDLAARYGGEEIGILLPETDLKGALAVAERIRDSVEAQHLPHSGSPHGVVTLSAGVAAIIPQRGADQPATLLAAADKALYEAKHGGRNRVVAQR
jgi:diguanylate cyclase (GGDEF)-like protein